MSFEIHREPLYRRYYASFFSEGSVFALFFGFAVIFLPLILAYNSSGFWLKESVEYEQPSVKFRYEVLCQFLGNDKNGGPLQLFYSTSPTMNQLQNHQLRVPVLTSAELDDNRDGIPERLASEEINEIKMLIFHDVKISNLARYVFDSVTYFSYESKKSVSNLFVDGEIEFNQKKSLTAKGGYRYPYSDDELLTLSSTMSASDISFSSILAQNAARDLSISLKTLYQYAETNQNIANSDYYARFVNISITERIVKVPVRYTPPISQVLKMAWIQYVAVFAIIAFLLNRLSSFIFRHQLIHTHTVVDVMHEKLD